MVANKNIITRLIEVREFVSLKTPGFHKHRAFVTYLDISSQQSSQLNLVSSPSDDTPHYHRSVSLTSKGCIIDAHTRGIFLNRYRFAKYDVYH